MSLQQSTLPQPEPKLEPKLEPEPEVKLEPEPELNWLELKREPQPEPELEPKLEPEPEVKLEPEPEPKVEPKPAKPPRGKCGRCRTLFPLRDQDDTLCQSCNVHYIFRTCQKQTWMTPTILASDCGYGILETRDSPRSVVYCDLHVCNLHTWSFFYTDHKIEICIF